MNFCIISPTAGLERYATLSKTHLVLAHIKDDAYENFYCKRNVEGDFIILDNGAYESGEPMESKELCERIRFYKPDVAVLPDYPGQHYTKTLHASAAFLKQHAHKFPSVEWMFVPQAPANALYQWFSAVHTAKSLPISWIGLSRVPALLSKQPHIRMIWAQFVREHCPKLKMHALGMLHGDYHELYYLNKLGVSSIDSSAPVWRGWRGVKLDEPWDGEAVDFGARIMMDTEANHEYILNNLEVCNVRTTTR